jgi:radical SAM superfamily enzyme
LYIPTGQLLVARIHLRKQLNEAVLPLGYEGPRKGELALELAERRITLTDELNKIDKELARRDSQQGNSNEDS